MTEQLVLVCDCMLCRTVVVVDTFDPWRDRCRVCGAQQKQVTNKAVIRRALEIQAELTPLVAKKEK